MNQERDTGRAVTRRDLLRLGLAAGGAAAGLPMLAACSSGSSAGTASSAGASSGGGKLVIGAFEDGAITVFKQAIVPLFKLMDNFHLLNTRPGLVVVYVAFAMPFTVFFMYPFFRRLPTEMAEAAAVDGAGEWRTFFQVMLPMAKPGLASVAIFNFLGLWNQFLLPVALNTNQENYVLAQGLSRFASSAGYAVDFGALFAAVVITVVPVLVLYIIFQRQLAGSVTQGTMK